MKRKMEVTVSFDVPFTSRWLDRFITLRSAPELIPFFPNAKEITETVATFSAIRKVGKRFPDILNKEDVTCVVPGDGVMPRTGAYAAYNTKWNVVSIDPLMNESKWVGVKTVKFPRRLRTIKSTIEDITETFTGGLVVVLSVHSHARLNNVLDKINADTVLIAALECCVPMELDYYKNYKIIRTREYRDGGVWSPENRMKAWELEHV